MLVIMCTTVVIFSFVLVLTVGTSSVGEERIQIGVFCDPDRKCTFNCHANGNNEVNLESILSDKECSAEDWALLNKTKIAYIESGAKHFSYPVMHLEKKRLTVHGCVYLVHTCTDNSTQGDTTVCIYGKELPEPQSTSGTSGVVVLAVVLLIGIVMSVCVFVHKKRRKRDEEMGTRSNNGNGLQLLEQMKSLLK